MVKIDFEFKRKIVYDLLELAKKDLLKDADKKKIVNIVNSLERRTESQKYRFCLLYNLYVDEKNKYILSEIARKENVRPSAVRQSIARIRNSLVNSTDENLNILYEILKEYK